MFTALYDVLELEFHHISGILVLPAENDCDDESRDNENEEEEKKQQDGIEEKDQEE